MRRSSIVPSWSASQLVVLVAVTACTESAGPAPGYDPAELRSSLAAVDTVFASPLASSVGVFLYGAPIPPPVAAAPLIPDSLLGRTFAWSCDTRRYVLTTLSGAPAGGVRLLLYALDATGAILCPATVIGQLDLADASTGDTTALRASATPVGQSAEYVDYTIRHATADPQFLATATGSIRDGHTRLDFHLVGRPGAFNTRATTMQLDDSAADVHETLSDSVEMGVDTRADDFELTVRHTADTLELSGWVGRTFVGGGFESWDQVITLNRTPYAKVDGMAAGDAQPPLVRLGRPLPFTGEERQLLLDLIALPGNLLGDFARLLGAGARLVGSPL